METTNTHRPISRTLVVIDGGSNFKAAVQTQPAIQKPKLLEQVRQAIRTRHYSYRTQKAYVHWIRRYIFFHNKRHPMEMAEPEIGQFLSSLATEGHVSASTQNQAFNALLFLYHEVLNKKIGLVEGVVRAKRPQLLPVVLTKKEVKKIIDHMSGVPRLMAILLYGAGLRLMECCRLRVKDIDFSQNEIMVRAGKGNKDRHTPLPSTLRDPLVQHLQFVKTQHEVDLKAGLGRVSLPNALERKYPNAGREWVGNGFSPRPATLQTGPQASGEGIIFTSLYCSAHFERRGLKLESLNTPAVTPCAIPLPPIYWKMATTSERCRSCSVTTT